MDSFQAIHAFLAAVRRRLARLIMAARSLQGLALLAAALLAAPLLAAAASRHDALAIQRVTIAIVVALVLAWIVFGWFLPRRRRRHDREVARYVGGMAPRVASDLLSTIELEPHMQETAYERARFSTDLAHALAESTAMRVATLDHGELVPRRRLKRPLFAFAGSLGLYVLLGALAPDTIAAGWDRLLHPPDPRGRLHEAVAIAEPIVGDITLTLEFPRHTGRATMVVPASSGDILAPRGTKVTLETTALRPAETARILLDRGDPIPLVVNERRLTAQLTVDKPAAFRFELTPPSGAPFVETDPHRIDVEPDRAPRVELFAPADELDVSSRRRIELAYSIEDDYGISEIALVWKAEGDKEQRKILPAPRPGARTAQAKFLWDLSELEIAPGSRVAYHLESKDNDTISGPNVGKSRTFHLRVFSPRERHEEIVARQAEVFELALGLLGDRLVLRDDDTMGRRQAEALGDRLVVEIGTLLALIAEDKLAPKGLDQELEAMRGRLDKLAREEAPNRRWVPELEKDVLILDDWIARQRIEDLLAISDEIAKHRERLSDLLDKYERTKDPALREEIEREIRAIEQRLAELERKALQLGGEVADQFMNHEALADSTARDCMAEVRELLDKGDVVQAGRKLEQCTRMLDRQAQGLEQGLRGLRGERFSEEEKAYSELMDEIGDLEQAEQEIAKQADELLDEYKQRAAEATRDVTNPHREKAKKILEKLKKELGEVPEGGLTPFSQEELEAIERRVDDVGRMLDEGDVAEAQSMARQAEQGLRMVEADLEDDLDDGEPWSDRTDEALERVAHADGIAQDLVEELEQAMPSPSELMTPEDRAALEKLARKQAKVRERTRRLSQKAEKRADKLPQNAGDAAKKGLEDAAQQMERGEERMDARDPMGAREEARGAADKLAKLRENMQRSSRPQTVGNGRGLDDEPVRIPGSEEYRAPEKWREDILEGARRGSAPREYKEQVERYFKELIK
jgi:hypothetical protein